MRRKTWGAVLIATAFLASGAARAQEIDKLYQAGRRAFESGEVYQAVELLGAVADADPRYRDVQLLLGQALLVSGRQLDAKRRFERVLEDDPGNAHAAFLLGLALHQSARYFEAAEALERAHELAPENPNPLIYRGLALLELGRPDEARTAIETALGLAPRDPTARTALAELELAAGRLQSAEALAREVLAEPADSGGDDARALLGRILVAEGRPAEAVPVLREALASPSAGSAVTYLLAQALLRSGDTEAGRSAMERFKAEKALEEEVKVLEGELAADPGAVEPRIRLARLLLDNDKTRASLNQFIMLRKLAPDDPRVRALAVELGQAH